MTDKLLDHIVSLLFDHTEISIFGLGSFLCETKSSEIDHIQGTLFPQSSTVSFVTKYQNDGVGILATSFAVNNRITILESKMEISKLASVVKECINNEEIFIFPNLGKLYKDFEGKIIFLPENNNYNTSSFGLPPVKFFPIVVLDSISWKESFTPIVQPKREAIVQKKANKKDWVKLSIPYAIAASMALAVFGFYKFTQLKPITRPVVNIEMSNHNVKPSLHTSAYSDDDVLDEDSNLLSAEDIINDEINTDGITPWPDQKEAIIIIHSFSKKAYVNRLIKKLSKLGYSPYSDKMNGLMRVGIQFEYEDEAEVNEKLSKIQDLMNPGAYVVEN